MKLAKKRIGRVKRKKFLGILRKEGVADEG